MEGLGPEGAEGFGQTWRQGKEEIKAKKDKSVTRNLAPVKEPEPKMTLTEEVQECRSAVRRVRRLEVPTGPERADGVSLLARRRRKTALKTAPCSLMHTPQKSQAGRPPAVPGKLGPESTPKEQVEKGRPSERSMAQKSDRAAKTG